MAQLRLQGTAEYYGAAESILPPDVDYIRTLIANVVFVGPRGAGDRGWVLVDTGVRGSAAAINAHAAMRFGAQARPAAIILTHGHFDHVGAVIELADAWECPVYAHFLEQPYLTGRSSYPPPDATVGGGVMANLAFVYPKRPINLRWRARVLPQDGSVPGMPGWRWIHTPGHTAGHVSLYREADAMLIAGDAVITTKQESALAVAVQKPVVHGPPMYFTPDWLEAGRSVQKLAALEPWSLLSGHGKPMSGDGMRTALRDLADNFAALAVPRAGRYVRGRALADSRGTVFVPPRTQRQKAFQLLAVSGIGLAGWLLYDWKRSRIDRRS